jgi:predicted O-methyltransferase YrrM
MELNQEPAKLTAQTQLPRLLMRDLFPLADKLAVPSELEYCPADCRLPSLAYYYLGCLTLLQRPARVLEMGTGDGTVTQLLARCAPAARIVTFEQPQAGTEIGRYIRSTSTGGHVTQLQGDPFTFDWHASGHAFDLITIDTQRAAPVVATLTQAALELVNGQNGIVIWEGCSLGTTTYRLLLTLCETHAVIQLAETDLAILRHFS